MLHWNSMTQKWFIRDGQWNDNNKWIPSKNGTFLNGREVSMRGAMLRFGDIITIGTVQ